MESAEIAVNGVGGLGVEIAVDVVVSVGGDVFIGAHEDTIKTRAKLW
ncbi:MAG: hypothetical protein IPJ46_11570 [Anaerolineales bacterium]|nr:hypothetical protein [Anaerolineales bacterium]